MTVSVHYLPKKLEQLNMVLSSIWKGLNYAYQAGQVVTEENCILGDNISHDRRKNFSSQAVTVIRGYM
jgi:hypothetical protein